MRHQAIYNTHSKVKGIWGNGTCVDKDANPVEINEALVGPEIIRLQAESDAQAYARYRKKEYNDLNQFELISHDTINGTTTHKDAIVAIKTKWPKDNSGPVA